MSNSYRGDDGTIYFKRPECTIMFESGDEQFMMQDGASIKDLISNGHNFYAKASDGAYHRIDNLYLSYEAPNNVAIIMKPHEMMDFFKAYEENPDEVMVARWMRDTQTKRYGDLSMIEVASMVSGRPCHFSSHLPDFLSDNFGKYGTELKQDCPEVELGKPMDLVFSEERKDPPKEQSPALQRLIRSIEDRDAELSSKDDRLH